MNRQLRARARTALLRAAAGDLTLTAAQVARLSNVDFLIDSADEEIDILLDELGIADPDEIGEPEEPQAASAHALRERIRAASTRSGRARLQAQYRALPLEQRRVLISAERDDEASGRHVVPRLRVVRADDAAPAASANGTLYGHFAVFDTWTEVDSMWEGNFLESIRAGAFADTITNDGPRMRSTLNHGRDPSLGNKVLGKITALREDAVGGYYEVALYRGIPELVLEGLRDGAYGASFRFYVMAEEFTSKPKASAYNPRGIPERVITQATVEEFGPVTFPQYPEATAMLRSLASAPPVRKASAAAPHAASSSRSREEQWLHRSAS